MWKIGSAWISKEFKVNLNETKLGLQLLPGEALIGQNK